MTLADLQHFKYAGGGYFRDARVPKGKTAPVLHGSEIIGGYTEAPESSSRTTWQ